MFPACVIIIGSRGKDNKKKTLLRQLSSLLNEKNNFLFDGHSFNTIQKYTTYTLKEVY